MDHDDQGRIFLDFDPYCFQQILFYLRSCTNRSSARDTVALPNIDPDKQEAFRDLVKFLLLEDFMGISSSMSCAALKFTSAHSEARISNEGQTASIIAGSEGPRSILVGPMTSKVCFMKCKINCLKAWGFIGIADNINVQGDTNYSLPISYGWGRTNQHYSKGSWVQGASPVVSWSNGDWVLIKVDFLARRLSMRSTQVTSPAHIPFQIAADFQASYGFHVILYSAQDEVELLPVTMADQRLLP